MTLVLLVLAVGLACAIALVGWQAGSVKVPHGLPELLGRVLGERPTRRRLGGFRHAMSFAVAERTAYPTRVRAS